MSKWLETKDGIWPMFIRDVPGGQLYVTQYGRGHWRWAHFNGHAGHAKIGLGKANSGRAAKAAALASAGVAA